MAGCVDRRDRGSPPSGWSRQRVRQRDAEQATKAERSEIPDRAQERHRFLNARVFFFYMQLSVVLPVHNEEPNLRPVYKELRAELDRWGSDYELIFVDDGSTDKSYEVLTELVRLDPKVRVVKLLARSGQSTAMAAGIDRAHGSWIVTMDADGQHDPRDIPKLLAPLAKGYHVVCGWRTGREASDAFVTKNLPSRLSNWLVNRVSGLRLKDSVGGFKAFDRRVTEAITIFGDLHRYLPVLAAWKGFRVTEAPIRVRKRRAGTTKYTWRRLTRGFWDLLVVKFFISWSNRPSQFFGPPGLAALVLGALLNAFLLVEKFARGIHVTRQYPLLLIFAILLVILGFILVTTGFIADMISYNTIANSSKKAYVVDHVVQAKEKEQG